MKYELDFIGVKEETQDADAVGIHWIEDDKHTIGVYDGGFSAHGDALNRIINNYYFTDNKKEIDFIVCSHSDQDHVSGLKCILENCTVKKLYVNRPWLYIEELYKKINDERITKKSLEERLKKTYKYIEEIETLAAEKGIDICEAFEGTKIAEKLTILQPSKETYIDLIVESNKTTFLEMCNGSKSYVEKIIDSITVSIRKFYNWITETWTQEELKEDVSTSAENETSIILIGDMEDEKFLLVGDAGIKALNKANDYYSSIGGSIKDDVKIYQVPHHGSRHNVNSSTLNSIIGEIVAENETINKTAFVCAGKNSDHPLKMVTNAFIRRGVQVFVASGSTIHHHFGLSLRDGWSSAKKQEFSENVEEWES